ncbi:MAG: DinB family protein [Phycisphaerales bacterium]|nr:DinB family protein [Phycisphaerales bacterium]
MPIPDIARYEAGAAIPTRAIQGLTPEQLNAHPVMGTWSIQQIIVHLLESDLAATHRMRRIAAEDLPLIIAYDETRMADRLAYEKADLKLVCQLFELNRRFTAQWLRTLPPEAFDREGIHNQVGKVSLARIVEMYINHVDHHLKFIRDKRAMLGSPLPF